MWHCGQFCNLIVTNFTRSLSNHKRLLKHGDNVSESQDRKLTTVESHAHLATETTSTTIIINSSIIIKRDLAKVDKLTLIRNKFKNTRDDDLKSPNTYSLLGIFLYKDKDIDKDNDNDNDNENSLFNIIIDYRN